MATTDNSRLSARALDRARLSRDPRFDGKFFIAVTTTGIYCRPICPVRSPKPAHIRYYLTAAAAAEAGFRPCLRCRPEAAPGSPAWIGTSAVVRRALRLIDDGFLDNGSVDDLALRVGIGARHLHRLFVQHVGAPPVAVAQTRRLHFAKRLLDDTVVPITEVALASGFKSVRRFNDAFLTTYGRPPRDLRTRKGRTDASRDDLVVRLAYRPPYDWSHVRDFLALRAIPGVEQVDATGYARAIPLGDRHALIVVRPAERERGDHALELRVQGALSASLMQLSSNVRRMFDLAADPMRIATAFAHDRVMAPLVKRRPGIRIPGAWDPFECAVRAIVGQQVSVAAGRTLLGRIVARAGRPIASGVDGLTHLFPSAAELSTADLDGLGLTGARIRTIRALAQVVEKGLDFGGPASEVMAALVDVPGIGEWTAHYVALRGLGEPDAFPAGDLILRRAASLNGTSLTARALEARAEAWRPWRGYATIHLWRASADRR